MGTPKVLLPFDDEPLVVHIVRALEPLFSDIVLVASPEQEFPPGLPARIVRDEVAYQGPVGGICNGLKMVTHECAFVSSCDSAFLKPDLVRHLVSLIADCDVVAPEWNGRLQPLLAVYRTSVLPIVEAYLASGERRAVSLLEKVRTKRVDEGEIRRYDPDGESFFNINTAADYEEALARWRIRR